MMQPIHVQRYAGSQAWAGNVIPEDRSWIVFIAVDGEATFWRRVSVTGMGEKLEHTYVDAELPSAVFEGNAPAAPLPRKLDNVRPLDFTITEAKEPFGDALSQEDHEREAANHPEARHGFYAWLNVRSIACWGETEHEAIRGLLNYVAQLCTAGSLDHTGAPVLGNARRYKMVFGDPSSQPEPMAVDPSAEKSL